MELVSDPAFLAIGAGIIYYIRSLSPKMIELAAKIDKLIDKLIQVADHLENKK